MYYHKSGCSLRKINREDLRALLNLKEESWWGTHKVLINNIDDQKEWYDSIPSNSLYMIAEMPILGILVPIGVAVYTDIDHQNRSLRISGSIYKEHRNVVNVKAGFAAGFDFAFEMLNMERVEAQVLECNVPAQQLEIDFLGFKVEGRRRKAVYKCGRYYDSIMLGMLREEWAAHPRVVALGDTCNHNFSHDKMMKLADRFSREKEEASASLSLVVGATPIHQF